MAKLDWRKAKRFTPEREPTGPTEAGWAEHYNRFVAPARRKALGLIALECRACGHRGNAKLPKDRRAAFVCSRCGSHSFKAQLIRPASALNLMC